jgi:hypothetical protein
MVNHRLIVTTGLSLLAIACVSPTPQPTVTALSGSFRYTKTDGAFLVGGLAHYEVLVKQTREVWIASDGSGRLRVRYGQPQFFGERDRQEWGARELPPEDTTYGPGGFSVTDPTGLPTEPGKLRALLSPTIDPTDPGSGTPAWETFMAARAYLWETVPPPTVSRAIQDVLRTTPGIVEKVNDHDRAARSARSYTIIDEHNQLRNTLLLDPTTGALLGEQQDLLKSVPTIDGDPPLTIKYATYLEAKLVDSTVDR